MSAPWWVREAFSPEAQLVKGTGVPVLAQADRAALVGEVRGRVKAFTPEWRSVRADDAGQAFLRVFSEELEAVLLRLDRYPQKVLVEVLSRAGVAPLPPTPAETLVEFTASPSAPRPALVPKGFQLGARPPGGDLVVFETQRNLYVSPAKLAEVFVFESRIARPLDLSTLDAGGKVFPFGASAKAGCTLYLGLSGDVLPRPVLSLGVGIWAPPDAPAPVAMGGLAPLSPAPAPLLRWEALDGNIWAPCEVVLDQTRGLTQSGVIELSTPASWRPARPSVVPGTTPRSWLRLRIVLGRYPQPPALSLLRINAVLARAVQTVRDEPLEPGADQALRLSRTPVVANSLWLEVDDDSALGGSAEQPATARRWKEVDDLGACGQDDAVFMLDPLTGQLAFGDGVHGMALPQGYRNVRAVSYEVGGGLTGAVDADVVTALLSSAPFVTKASNPQRASGGTDVESQDAALLRGPQELRARGRAVAPADYGLLALRAPGAQVVRAMALPGQHPSYPGLKTAGVVGVLVVPRPRAAGPPIPDQATLEAVARYLSSAAAPAGVDVVAAAPTYQRVRAQLGLVVASGADVGTTVSALLAAIDYYLHPITGGEDGQGWPFGGPLLYAPLLRRLLAVPGVRAIPRLNLLLDQVRLPACSDSPIAPNALLWGDGAHEVVPEVER
jgi:predicted phage baseplate assembly protein